MKISRHPLALALGLTLAVSMPRPAWAIDRDLRSILVGGGYGLLGGTVLGLASYPLTRDARSIWIGSSVGLYLGIVLGIYNAAERDNPTNPLHVESAPPTESPLQSEIQKFEAGPPPSAEKELGLAPSTRPDLEAVAPAALRDAQKNGPPAWLELKIPVARF